MKTVPRLPSLHQGVSCLGIALALALTAVPAARSLAADLPVQDGLITWLKADAVNTGDSTEVRVSGSDLYVKLWKDQSGNNHPASNSTDADQPLYIAGALNGLPALRFAQDNDDSGDRLYLGDLGVYSVNAGSIFVVATVDNDGRYNLFGNRNGADERWVADTWSESHPGSWRTARAGGTFTQGGWPTYGSHVFALESSRSVYQALVDGAGIGSDTADYHSGAGSNWTIANRSTDGQQFRGDIAEVIIYNHILTAAEADQVGYYLATKYGVTTAYTGTGVLTPQATIYDLGLPGNPGIINGTNIAITVPFRTDVTALAPTYMISTGATCDKASGSAQNFQTPQLYTVISSDHATTNIYLVTVIVRPPSVTYDFNSGLQGWAQIWPTAASGYALWQNNALGSGYDRDDPYSRFARSPAFILHGLEELTIQLAGGQSPLATPAAPSAIPERAIDGGGFAGVALRDVATDTYVLWKRRTGNGGGYQTERFTTNQLAPYVGKKYTLDYMDYNMGGWGWTYLDNVSISGYGTQLSLEAADTALSLGLPGSTLTAVLKIPEGANQYNAVTVYVTNGNPAALTINGSSAAVVSVTFSQLGANTANLTLAGTAVGTVPLRAHTANLDDASLTITVAPALIGRWASGAANLNDASGFRPAGTHDGVAVGTTANLAYTTEVPPGCTGQSLDLRAGSVGVMINNTATSDAGYVNTFDDVIRNKFTVAFWAKGFPGGWSGWVSKRGEDGIGWQLRRMSSDPIAGFTIRGVDNEDGWGSSINVNDNKWHHFAGVWDQATGTRKLYVDGIFSHTLNNTIGQRMNQATAKHLALGARQQGGTSTGFDSYFSGLLYDVRMFSYPLSETEVRSLIPAAIQLAGRSAVMVGTTTPLTVAIPAWANASSSVTVTVASSQPGKVLVNGSGTAAVVFAAGAATSQTVTLQGVEVGSSTITASSPGLAAATRDVEVYGMNTPGLIGHWVAGAPHLADVSGYYMDGTHDGSYIGVPSAVQFTNDLPLGRSGSALDLRGPNVAVRIDNSRAADAGYQPTFDTGIYTKFSVAFWAKGFPGTWNCWVSKYGENGEGWQLRRMSDSSFAGLTVRGQPDDDGWGSSINVNDNNWHHYLGVWDGETGNRTLYVDGVFSHTITGGYAPMNQAPNAHLALGARGDDSDNYGSWFKGLLYDVRLYNTALAGGDALDIVGAILTSPQSYSLVTPSPNTNFITVMVPPSAVAAGNVVITVTSDKPGVAIPEGAVGGVLTVTLPMGGGNTTNFAVAAVGAGTAHFTYSCATLPSAGITTIAVQQPNINGLVGSWNFDTKTLAETSGFQPAGTHDGVAVGTVAYVPGRLGGYAADLRAANTAIRVQNSQINDANYRTTFDAFLFSSPNGFTWTAWVKGLPVNEWSSWIAKDGEAFGYAIRKYGNGPQVTFTLRNSTAIDDPYNVDATITDELWHHVAAVWDPVNFQRRLYVDGAEKISIADTNLVSPATATALFFGAREATGDTRFARTIVDEIQAYDKALTAGEIAAQVGAPMVAVTPGHVTMNLGDPDEAATITVPPELLVSGAVSVTLTTANAAIASPVGGTGGSITVNFPMGGANTATVYVRGVSVGTTTISATSSAGAVNGDIVVKVIPTAILLGHWAAGQADLKDTSGHTPAGTHDGTAVGANAALLTYSMDVPNGFFGQSLDLSVGTVGVAINNSSWIDGGYLPTFDSELATNCTIAFWAKGMPPTWAGWLSKCGEPVAGGGYQVRRYGGDNVSCFTIRGLDNDDGGGSGINVNDGNWHHYAAIWDQAAAARYLYVDGVFSHTVNNTPGQTMKQAVAAHLVFGGLQDEAGNYWNDRWTPCFMFDVRIYKNTVCENRIKALLTSPGPELKVQPWTGNQLRIAWPANAYGYTLQKSAALPGGWSDAGLSLTIEGNDYVVYPSTTEKAEFYRLVK